jgi:GTP pyrophosphokinase
MLLAMVDDIRVILVKLADRLHNMRTLNYLPRSGAPDRAGDRDIYAPIANRLGMSKVKNELEELAFRYLEPQAYQTLRARGRGDQARDRRVHRHAEEAARGQTRRGADPVVSIDGRIKRLWSDPSEAPAAEGELDQIYDFVALRVITQSTKDCYAVLGIIHQMWAPVPGRFKDFVAMPRPNGYQRCTRRS